MLNVAITGLGCIASTGMTVLELSNALRAGRSLADVALPSDWSAHLDEPQLVAFDRASQLSVVAAKLAYADAGAPHYDEAGLGVSLGSTYGGHWAQLEIDRTILVEGPQAVRGTVFSYGVVNASAANVGIVLRARGPNLTQATGASAGADACAEAARHIEGGAAVAMIAGGVEVLTADLRAWRGAVGESGLAEGVAVIVLEAADAAVRRGARVYGRILGASSRLADDDSREARARAAVASARQALAEAGVPAASTRLVIGDDGSLAPLFDGHMPATLRIDGVLGDTLSAAGAFQVIAALVAAPPGTADGPVLTLSMSRDGIATSLVLHPSSTPPKEQPNGTSDHLQHA